jgi:DNA-3-methyladenine glycosylase
VTLEALPRALFEGPAPDVAPLLLGALMIGDGCSARIVEVEAYTQDDPASHSFRGLTPRCRAMFGPPGHWYVYFTYGMHWCANVVCGPEGSGQAVLVRAALPVDGLEVMRARRPRARTDRQLLSGPARLAQAFAMGRADDGTDACSLSARVRLASDGVQLPVLRTTARVGISVGTERLWRFCADGAPR